MENRVVEIPYEVVEPLEKLVKNFPEPSIRGCFSSDGKMIVSQKEFMRRFDEDLEKFRDNQKILYTVMDANYEFYRTDNIAAEEKRSEDIFLSVQVDTYVESLIYEAKRLQNEFFDILIRRD